ncbi:MAG TPA: DUF72 domain-containing protein [Gemmataceae bacterium]|nr:DUF72 domain-containing protein [Gemmataceae bacterium]
MHPIRIGTCGWSYQDWSDVFYPKELPAGEYLTFYAERFPVVEVDSTFYHSPSRKTVEGWDERTPPSFGFSLKVPQVITHEKILADCRKELNTFLTAARVLESKLLCCLLQFGYFNKQAFASLDDFLQRLDPFLAEWPKDVPVAVEVRNKNWMTAKFVACLRTHGATWALADQAWVPSPWSLLQKLDVLTGPFAYVRLLGDRAEVDKRTEKLDHTVIDRSEQLDSDAQAIRWLSERVPVLAFANNHFAGYAPETIRELLAKLDAAQSV